MIQSPRDEVAPVGTDSVKAEALPLRIVKVQWRKKVTLSEQETPSVATPVSSEQAPAITPSSEVPPTSTSTDSEPEYDLFFGSTR